MQRHVSREFGTQGFKRKVLSSISSAVKFELFWKDSTEVFNQQLRNRTSSKILLQPFQKIASTQSMNAKMGLKPVPAAQNVINSTGDRTIFWESKHRYEGESAYVCLQLFSDPFHVKMSARSLVFYPLRIALLNFTKEIFRSNIQSHRTTFSYLPVCFDVENCCLLQLSSKSHERLERSRTAAIVAHLRRFTKALRLV